MIVELAEKERFPAICACHEQVRSRGLLAHADDLPDTYRHNAQQTDQVLKGAKPGDIPFCQAAKFELVINPKPQRRSALQSTLAASPSRRGDRMKRRDFVILAAASIACPSALDAEPAERVRTVGIFVPFNLAD
jgi:hypothetical protein